MKIKQVLLTGFIFVQILSGSFAQMTSLSAIDGSMNVDALSASMSSESVVGSNGGAATSISTGNFQYGGTAQLAMSSSNYLVTPGDIYTLAFSTGATTVKYTIPIDISYKVRVANLGVLDASNMTFVQFRKQVEDLVNKNFPMSGVQFVLTTPSTFKVVIKGEVKQTCERDSWALTRLSSIISGCVTEFSSVRNITITSHDGSVKTYDLFLAKRDGDLSQDPYLKPGDVVTLGRIDRKVSVRGSVERPGAYELLPGENLTQLINRYAGGLDKYADVSRIELTRLISEDKHLGDKIYLSKENIDDDYVLECWDSVYVTSLNEVRPAIYVEGAIRGEVTAKTKEDTESTPLTSSSRRIVYFHSDEDYAYLIRKNAHWFTGISNLEDAYIKRGQEVIPVNIYTVLHNPDYRIKLDVQADDILVIPFRQFFVNVSGAVAVPGRYPYVPDRDYNYYIGLAGGFTDKNARSSVRIIDMNNIKHSKKDIIEPEMTIIARSNSFIYQFNRIAVPVTTILTAVYTGVLINHYAND